MKRIFLIVMLAALGCGGCYSVQVENEFSHPLLDELARQELVTKDGVTYFGKNRKVVENGIKKVYLEGSPFEIGYAHGILLQDEIRQKLDRIISGTLDDMFFIKRFFAKRYFMKSSRELEQHIPEEFLEELHGIAEGSGIEYWKIALWTNMGTIVVNQGCSGFSFKDIEGKIITGRQLDLSNAEWYQNMVLLIVKPEKGHGFFTMTQPGVIDMETGMNEKGLTLSQDYLRSISQDNFNIMPISVLTRQIVQYAQTLEEAEALISKQEELPVRLLLISTPESASVFEMANKEYEKVPMEDGYVAVSNHARVLQASADEDTLYRLERTERYLKARVGGLKLPHAINLMRSDFLGFMDNRGSFLFSPSTLNFWVASVPAEQTKPASFYPYYGFHLLHELYGTGEHAEPEFFEQR